MNAGQLSGNSIACYPNLVISPFNSESVQPASYDLHISDHFLIESNADINLTYSYDYPVIYTDIRTSVFTLLPDQFSFFITAKDI